MKRGFFGIGIFNAKRECNIGTLWRSAHAFGADFLFTVGARYKTQSSDTGKSARHVPLYHYASLDDLVEHLPLSCPLVGVELYVGAEPLTSFNHPVRACYLLGAEDHGLSQASLEKCHKVLYIEGAERCLNVAVAGSIALYDRWRQFDWSLKE